MFVVDTFSGIDAKKPSSKHLNKVFLGRYILNIVNFSLNTEHLEGKQGLEKHFIDTRRGNNPIYMHFDYKQRKFV